MINVNNPLGFDGLEPKPAAQQADEFQKQNDEHYRLCEAYATVFKSKAGKLALDDLTRKTLKEPTWCASLGLENGAAHGFAREGQNSIVKYILERINEFETLKKQRGNI